MPDLVELYPQHRALDSIQGIYLNEPIPNDRTFVYANLLSSLDGRIALGKNKHSHVPPTLMNANDFRLFLELQAHADCIITHGAYLIERAQKSLGDILNIGKNKEHQDLRDWRVQHQLPQLCKIVICSNSLEFPDPTDLQQEQILIATSACSSADKRKYWEDLGYPVIICGENQVEGELLCRHLETLQVKRIFLCSGPQMLSSMIAGKRLQRLYLTLSHCLIGHEAFHTLIEGEASTQLDHCQLQQARLIYDQSSTLKQAQWYARFDVDYVGET